MHNILNLKFLKHIEVIMQIIDLFVKKFIKIYNTLENIQSRDPRLKSFKI